MNVCIEENCNSIISSGARRCMSCATTIRNLNRPRKIKTILYCSECNSKLYFRNKSGLCRSCSSIVRANTATGKAILSRNGKLNLGRKHTEIAKENFKIGANKQSTRLKKREARIKEIKEKGIALPNYNPNACKIIDEYGKKYDYSFQHAMRGGEFKVLGYFVDGYDKDKNVVIEYYEQHHRNQTKRDIKRQKAITDHLNCKFIIIEED